MARRGLLLLDGLDEGGTLREQVERHVQQVLAPQGHVVVRFGDSIRLILPRAYHMPTHWLSVPSKSPPSAVPIPTLVHHLSLCR